jgi:hypothetical protein
MDCLPQVHVAAAHSQPGRESFVPGLGLMCSDDDMRYGVGAYQNSKGKGTVYATAGWMPFGLGPAMVGAAVGLATGYDVPVAPIGGLAVQLPLAWGDIYALAMPRTSRSPAVLGLSFTVRFGN